MVLFRILFYILLGYMIIQIVRLVWTAKIAIKGGSTFQKDPGQRREKDISSVARIVDEKRPDKERKKPNK